MVPELSAAETTWPYAALGIAFALYGIALILFGGRRFGAVESELHSGGYVALRAGHVTGLALVAAALGLLTALLILIG